MVKGSVSGGPANARQGLIDLNAGKSADNVHTDAFGPDSGAANR